MVGINYFSTELAGVEKVNKGRYVDIPLKKDDYLIFIPKDCQSCYDDNEGGVDLSVSIIGALPLLHGFSAPEEVTLIEVLHIPTFTTK